MTGLNLRCLTNCIYIGVTHEVFGNTFHCVQHFRHAFSKRPQSCTIFFSFENLVNPTHNPCKTSGSKYPTVRMDRCQSRMGKNKSATETLNVQEHFTLNSLLPPTLHAGDRHSAQKQSSSNDSLQVFSTVLH